MIVSQSPHCGEAVESDLRSTRGRVRAALSATDVRRKDASKGVVVASDVGDYRVLREDEGAASQIGPVFTLSVNQANRACHARVVRNAVVDLVG